MLKYSRRPLLIVSCGLYIDVWHCKSRMCITSDLASQCISPTFLLFMLFSKSGMQILLQDWVTVLTCPWSNRTVFIINWYSLHWWDDLLIEISQCCIFYCGLNEMETIKSGKLEESYRISLSVSQPSDPILCSYNTELFWSQTLTVLLDSCLHES